VVASLLTAGALAAGGLIWLLTDDPVELGSVWGAPAGTLAWSSADTGIGDTVYYVTEGTPGTFEIGYDVENTGRLPATVQGLGSPSFLTLSGMGRYPTFEEPDHRVGGEIVPFEVLTIEPGDSRYLVLRLRVTPEGVCTTPGASGIHSDPALRYQTLGIVPRTATIDLPFTVVTVCGDELPPSYNGF